MVTDLTVTLHSPILREESHQTSFGLDLHNTKRFAAEALVSEPGGKGGGRPGFGGGGGGREAKWGTQCRGSPAWLLGVIIAPTYDLIMVSIAPVLLHAASGDFAAWF